VKILLFLKAAYGEIIIMFKNIIHFEKL